MLATELYGRLRAQVAAIPIMDSHEHLVSEETRLQQHNDLFLWFTDYIFLEGSYGHSVIARDNVAQVLAEKVQAGYLSEDEAVGMAGKLLRENVQHFFRLPD